MRSWASHVNGAIAIARLRGTGQLRTKIGRNIFANLRIQIVSHSISGSIERLNLTVMI